MEDGTRQSPTGRQTSAGQQYTTTVIELDSMVSIALPGVVANLTQPATNLSGRVIPLLLQRSAKCTVALLFFVVVSRTV